MTDDDNKKSLHTDETVLSVTGLHNLDNDKPKASSKAEDNDKTVLTTFDDDNKATVLSGATDFLEQDNDATVIVSPKDSGKTTNFDATVLMSNDDATIISGATEAVQQAIKPDLSPRMGVGSTINNRFVLEKLLGRGGMGEVYLATDKRKVEAQDKNPYVAMKVLGENFKRHPQAFIALQREARKTQELAHPNIVTVYDFDRQGDSVYLTMEALSGKPMDEEIRSDARPISDAVHMITQCAQGLAYAHEKDLVHSDLKPGNLFLTEQGNVKLLDFGIARAFKSGKALENYDNKGTQDTVFDAGELGALTPGYASLEMINGEEPHPSDDVYALGLIACELLTGKHPFDKKMASTAMEEGLKVTKIKGLNKQQWYAIEKALAFKREDRIQDAGEFLKLFTAKSKTPLAIAAGIILIAFIGVGSISLFIEPEVGPKIPFEQLSQQTQTAFQEQLNQADMALKFEDYNGAIGHLDKAYNLHPHNKQLAAKADAVVSLLLAKLDELEPASRLKQVESLLSHESLTTNKQLEKYKSRLQP